MRSRLALLFLSTAAVAVFACADLIGVSTLPPMFDGNVPDTFTNPDSPRIECTNASLVMTTGTTLDTLIVSNGFAYAGSLADGVFRCGTSAVCSGAPRLVAPSFGSQRLEGFAPSALLYFTLQGTAGADAGSVHSANLDGTSDLAILTNRPYPSWIATSGARTFWVDDAITGSNFTSLTPSVVHCIGCAGSDTPWVTGLNATYGLTADTNDVYVLAGDGTTQGTLGVYGCSAQTACNGAPRVVTTGLDQSTSRGQVTSDGTNVYVARVAQNGVVRIDPSGTSLPMLAGITVTALAVDPVKGDLFFITGATVARVKSDGSTQAVTLASCQGFLQPTIAFDATNVYVVDADFVYGVYAIKRM